MHLLQILCINIHCMWTLISKLERHWSDPPCHHPDTGHPSQHHWAEEQTHDTAELPRLEGKHLAFWLIGYISYVRVSIICERHSRDDMRLFIQYPSTCITDALMRRCIESPKDSIKVNVTARHCRHCTRYKSEKCSQSTQIWQLCSAAPVVGAHIYCSTFCTLTARAQTIQRVGYIAIAICYMCLMKFSNFYTILCG